MRRTVLRTRAILTGPLLLAGAATIADGVAAQSTPAAPAAARAASLQDDSAWDPHRWLEAMASPKVVGWAQSQDLDARAWIAAAGTSEDLYRAIAATADHDVFTAPVVRGGRLFYSRWNAAGTRIAILVRDGLRGGESVVVDPDELAADGLRVDVSFWPSPDGSMLAYGVSAPDSRWIELRFRDVATGRDRPDRLVGLLGGRVSGVSWLPDDSGVHYDAFDRPAGDARAATLTGARVAFHRLGTAAPTDDVLVAAPPGHRLSHRSSPDGRWLLITQTGPDTTRLMAYAAGATGGVLPLLTERSGASSYGLVGAAGRELWVYTNRDAPNGRVVGITVDDPDPERWRTVVPESRDAIDTWTGAVVAGAAIVTGYRRDGALQLRISDPHDPTAESRPVPLARLGSVWFGVTGHPDRAEFFYQLSGFADPGTVYRHDLTTGRTETFLAPRLPYDPDDIVTRQVFFRGPAGTRIPMYLAHHRDTPPDGTRPVMMYGYAFGNWSASPWFRPHMAEWFRLGGVFALPALRGGGEFGAAWAAAGLRAERQNAVDDFVAAAEWLVAERLARPELLVAETNSAGASVVGAALVQRPDLFAAGILAFPLLDVLRYDRFTVGAAWRSQLGDPADPGIFRAMLAYAPIQNVRPGRCYPPVLITPGENDATTPPFHAYKFVAALQAAGGCAGPALLRVSWGAGHAYGRDEETTLRNFADQIAFLQRALTQWRPGQRD